MTEREIEGKKDEKVFREKLQKWALPNISEKQPEQIMEKSYRKLNKEPEKSFSTNFVLEGWGMA